MARLKWTLILAWVAMVALCQPANAAPTLTIDGNPSVVEVAPYLDLLEDPEGKYSQSDLRDPIFNARFEPLYRESANYGFSRSDWWVRFTVKNEDVNAQKVTFKLDYPLLDIVDVWVYSGTDLIKAWETGNRRAFGTRPIRHRDFLFPLTLAGAEEQIVYMRVRTEGPVNIGLTLYGEQTLLPKVETEYMIFGAYFGGFMLLALSVALLYLMDRQVAFLWYLTYILSYGSYMMAFNGLAFQFLWPDAPEFGQVSRPVLLTLSIIFLLQFSRSLLGVKRVSPFLHRSVTVLQVLLVGILLAVPFTAYGNLVQPISVLNLLALAHVISMGIVAHNRGEAAAKYYLMAWSIFLLGLMLYYLKVFGLVPHNFVTHYGFQIGSFCEFIFLSAALGVRVRELRHQSHIDELTGLANRRHFDEELAVEFEISSRPEAELSLLVVDVDHFKRFNDEYGHAAGDKVLSELGRVFKAQTRRPGTAYRYGGEEFVILLPRTSADEAIVLAERLREQVVDDVPFKNVTISVGVVSRRDGRFATPTDFFIAGDQALYKAKNAGRDCVAVYIPGLSKRAEAADDTESALA